MDALEKSSPAAHLAKDATARRARAAIAALFLTNGALFANILPRYPEIKAALALDNAGLGLSIAALPAGAIVAGLAAALIIRRFNSAKVAVFGTALTSLGYSRQALRRRRCSSLLRCFSQGRATRSPT